MNTTSKAALSVHAIAQLAAKQRPAFQVPWHPELMRYAELFEQAANMTRLVDPCMLAAIVNRESDGRNVFQTGMPLGPGCGVGLCQITAGVNWENPSRPIFPGFGDLLDPLTNLSVAACSFLQPALEAFPYNHIAAFAAYNLGIGGVEQELAQGLNPDARTTGNDYGRAVFTNWINYTAASSGYSVNWSSYSFN